ncbi:MAG: hypothetical protein Q9167_001189 [Letrouitia subvulpina]
MFSLPVRILLAAAAIGRYARPSTEEALSSSYAPIEVQCPQDVEWIRPARGLNRKEAEWVQAHKPFVLDALKGYLSRLELKDFDVDYYVKAVQASNYSHVPVMGLAISGGGSTSAFTGTGALRALDARLEASITQRTGGLLQSLTYTSGLSGGAWPVTSFAVNNFPTADEIVDIWRPEISRVDVGDSTQNGANSSDIFLQISEKAEAGFSIGVADYLGRAWAYEFVPGANGGLSSTFSSIANLENFLNHQMPYPIIQLGAISNSDKEILGLKLPYANDPIYEITPYEFGSWSGAVSGFTPSQWLGTQLNNAKPANESACVFGFDRSSFVLGAAGDAFTFWYIQDKSNDTLAPFSKRSKDKSSSLARRYLPPSDVVDEMEDTFEKYFDPIGNLNPFSKGSKDESASLAKRYLFPSDVIDEIVDAFQEYFNLSLSDIAYSSIPNPFAGLSTSSPEFQAAEQIKIVDASEGGQTIPLWGQIQSARESSFIIAWDAASDATPYNWNTGTDLYDTYLQASAADPKLPFPVIPPPATFVNRQYTNTPVLFGCDTTLTTTRDSKSPLVLYLANAPYSAYTNYSYTQSAVSREQMNEIFVNSFDLVTQGNSTINKDWPTCLGCATIDRSLEKVGMKRAEQCEECFEKYCWDGKEDNANPLVVDLALKLDPSLGFAEWNMTHPF